MKRNIATTGTALVLSFAALTAANATTLNTVPLNAQGKPVSSTPVAYGLTNTTINSSIKPYVPPTIKPATLNTAPLNTLGKTVSTTPVAYGLTNTTINSSTNPYVVPGSKPETLNTVPLNTQGKSVSSTPVAYGLTNTGNFATPNVKATVPKGAPNVPGQSQNYYNSAANSGGSFADTPSGVVNGIDTVAMVTKVSLTLSGAGLILNNLDKIANLFTTPAATVVAAGTTGATGANAPVVENYLDTFQKTEDLIEEGAEFFP
jgi:hypothetical protein